jgi:two-component system alkaline phosphatase synthesis response regulator PhoP
MIRVALVEDEPSIAEMIRFNLELDGYAVETYTTGKSVLDDLEAITQSSLIILDVMLPDKSGIELCKLIREKAAVPIIFVSAKGTTEDRITGLKAGANDYLPKPFDLEELLLRIRALTQFVSKNSVSRFEIGHYLIDFETFEVTDQRDATNIELTKKEIELLKLFQEKDGLVISRDEILDRVWGTDHFPTSRTIDNYILSFRKIFEKDPKNPRYFHSVRGVGYKFTSQE